MKRILVTGATGNIGKEVIHYLFNTKTEVQIIAAVRNIERAKKTFNNHPNLLFRQFDFEKEATFKSAFKQIDRLFLLRPPHISEVEKTFKPLLNAAKKENIKSIVFLSVQGAEKSSVIPHNKIELLLQKLRFQYIFVRPSYFMQNLTTTLLSEIVKYQTITLPSGNAKFNWIDVKNIGEATAQLLVNFDEHKNEAYEITGTENKNFKDVSQLMSSIIEKKIRFKSINPIRFYFKKNKEGIPKGFALVMTILHFLPRLQAEPSISNNYQKLTGKQPTDLKTFIEREKALFIKR